MHLVHCDLKPENILHVSPGESVRVQVTPRVAAVVFALAPGVTELSIEVDGAEVATARAAQA